MKVSIYILDKVSTVVLSEQEDKVKIFANSGRATQWWHIDKLIL
jgi:hypothetical protein